MDDGKSLLIRVKLDGSVTHIAETGFRLLVLSTPVVLTSTF